MADHGFPAQRYERLFIQTKMLGKNIRPGPLPRQNNAGPLRLQLASPKRDKIRRVRQRVWRYLEVGLGGQI
jgi:hypothetical protein